MQRLTHERSNGIKTGYWSPEKKEDLVVRLAEYENTGLAPDEIVNLNEFEGSNTQKYLLEFAKHRWIPVEERLPNEEEFREAYCRNAYAAEYIVMIKGATRPTTLYFREGCWFDSERNYYNVIAWMPLPEPYKGTDND